ncbi:MAG: fibronectin type III domain-containing protein [Microthrixaceae bacterium]
MSSIRNSRVPWLPQVLAALLAVSLTSALLTVAAPKASADAMMTTTFGYTGVTQTFTVPAGVTSLGVTVLGGQGGRGGTDANGPSPAGGFAGQVQGTISVTPGQVLTIAVGSGGASGNGGGGVLGGNGGSNPLAGYDGGTGGQSGTSGSSGSGGGGGAASVLQVAGSVIVAGGSGGSGGSGQYAPIIGRLAEDTFLARSDVTDTSGRPGLSANAAAGQNADGGGSGAGGGGSQGGERGADQYGGASATEWFGFGGFPGSNSTAEFSGLVESYQYFTGNNGNGSITLTYSVGVPDPVRSVVGAPGNGLIDVYWMPPLSAGGSPIVDYFVKYSTNPNGPFTTFTDDVSTTTRSTITGLNNGTPYYLQVTAVNALGESLPSTKSTVPVTPSATPDPKPILLFGFGGDSSASLQWSELSPPGSTVTDYQVEYATNVGGPWTTFNHAPTTEQNIVVTGLNNGTPYLFRVAAVTTDGQEPFSNAAPATPLGSPTPPTITAVTPMSSTLKVAFTAPTNTGGSPITGYQYQIDGGSWMPASQVSSPMIIGGLNNGQTYSVAIRAVTAETAGVASAASSATPFGLPGMVPGFTASPSTSSVTLNWDEAAANGSPVTTYNVILWSGVTAGSIVASKPVAGTERTVTFTGLGAGPRYFTIEAGNAAGVGPRTPERVTAVVGGTAPAAPSMDSVIVTGSGVALTWSSGAAGTSPISGYRIRYISDEGTITTLKSSATSGNSATVTVPSSDPYRLEISELSAAGIGEATTIRPPMTQTGTAQVNSTVTEVDLTGEANANGESTDFYFQFAKTEVGLDAPEAELEANPASSSSTSKAAVVLEDHAVEPATTYFFRTIARSGDMVAYGSTQTFTTNALVDITNSFKGYDGQPLDTAGSTSPSGLATSELWIGVNGTVYGPTSMAPSEAGDYTMTMTVTTPGYSGSETFDITIAKAPQTLEVNGVDAVATAGDIDLLEVLSSAGLTAVVTIDQGDGTVCSLNGKSLRMLAAGTCVISADQPGTRNYASSTWTMRIEVLAAEVTAPSTPPKAGGAGLDPVTAPGDRTPSTHKTDARNPAVGAGSEHKEDTVKSADTNKNGNSHRRLAFTGASPLVLLLLGGILPLIGYGLVYTDRRRTRLARHKAG